MTYLIGLVIAFFLFGGLELITRSLGLPLSIIGALGAVLRQTDSPGLQRRQALVMLLLVGGTCCTIVGVVMALNGLISRAVLSTLFSGVFLLTLAGGLGSRTLRAIGLHAAKQAGAANATLNVEPKSK
jgi:hypothetical protein